MYSKFIFLLKSSVPTLALIIATSSIMSQSVEDVKNQNKAEVSFAEAYWEGLLQLRAGNIDSAVMAFEYAQLKNPNHVKTRVNLARAYIDQGSLESAEALIADVIMEDSTNADAYRTLGRIYQTADSIGKAIEAYSKSIELSEDNPYAYNNLGLLYFLEGKYQEAVDAFETAVEQKENVAFFHNNLGMAYEGLLNFNEALENFARAIEIDPDYQKAQTNLLRMEGKFGIGDESTTMTSDIYSDMVISEDFPETSAEVNNALNSSRMLSAVVSPVYETAPTVAEIKYDEVNENSAIKFAGALGLLTALSIGLVARSSRRNGNNRR